MPRSADPRRSGPAPTPLPGRAAARDTATDRLTLAQYLSPAFPVGAYAYSQGLEQAMTDGHIRDAAGLTRWLTALLTHGSPRIDAILLAHARSEDPEDLADLAYAYAGSAERAMEMRDQGNAFGALIAALTGTAPPPLPYAIALGHATRDLALETKEILTLYLQSLTAQLISAAVRFMPLGAAEGQTVLARLAPLIARTAAEIAAAPLCGLASSAFGADLTAMAHETLAVRIFRS